MADNKKIAEDVLAAVGGKENVSGVTHCMTRLRFTLKDNGIPDTNKVKKIKGVIGAQESGGQYQVIIGQNVPKVYDEVCAMGGFAKSAAIDENLDAPKQKLTPKVIGNNILNYLSGSMVALIPILMAGGLFKCIGTLIGPQVFNLVPETDPTYLLFYTYLFDAAMYLLPVYLGYSAAKKIGASPVLGMFCGGILICPDIVALAQSGETSLTVYGISAPLQNYQQTVLPILLSVAALYWVEKFFKKIVPDVLSTVFTPFFTMVVMVPIELIVLGPIGNELGNLLSAVLFGMAGTGIGFYIAMAIVGGLWQLFVLTGMHIAVIMPALATFMALGEDKFIFVASNFAMIAVWGAVFGAALRIRNKEEKALTFGYVISAILGGVTEPALFGCIMRFKRMIPCMVAGGAVSGLLAGILGVTLGMPGANSNFLVFLGYLTPGMGNLINFGICFAVAFIVSAVLAFFFGITEADQAELDEE